MNGKLQQKVSSAAAAAVVVVVVVIVVVFVSRMNRSAAFVKGKQKMMQKNRWQILATRWRQPTFTNYSACLF